MAADRKCRYGLTLQAKMAFSAGAACADSSFFHSKIKAVQTRCTLVGQDTCALKQPLFSLFCIHYAGALKPGLAQRTTAC